MIGLPILGAIGMKAKSKDKKIRNELKPVAKSMLTGGMAFRLEKPDKYKSRVVDRSFSTAIKNANKRRKENDDDKIIQRNMGVKFTPKTGPNAGEQVAFRMKGMPPILREPTAKQKANLPANLVKAIEDAPVTRYKEDEATGMLRMEELKPLNRMGTVPLQRNEMPMAYKHKVYKPTAKAKAIPFTNKNAL